MEEKKTVQYKRTLRGSVGAGVDALFNGKGRKFYILEHRDASKYHKLGESQKIIIDQVELGRSASCQVRFDESFETVSRRHAAIIREGDRWKLVQLSTTNSTFLNGRPIESEWYLENGDEIQLAVGGPRLGFIVPSGKQSLVSSIKMTERLELFRKQALAPYKKAIWTLAALLILAVGGLTTWNLLMQKDFNDQIAQARARLTALTGKNKELDSLLMESQREQKRLDSMLTVVKNRKNVTKVVYPNDNLASLLSKVEDDVFFVRATKVVVTDGEETVEIPNYSWISTGFLTTDGRFITAKHCVEGWKFKGGGIPQDEEAVLMCAFAMNTSGCKIVAYLEAKSRTKTLTFKSTDFIMNRSTEHEYKLSDDVVWHLEGNMRNDWAYVRTNQKGSIVVDDQLSTHLPVGADLHILGFPHGWGAIDTHNFSSLYNSCKVAKEGLEDGIIRISSKSFEGGNSGGPVFYNDHGKLKAVGIVSFGVGESHGGIVSLSNLH